MKLGFETNEICKGEKNHLKDMWLTVIIPAYEVAGYIAKCLQSIALQCAGLACGIEVIVIDDGSLDDSGKIADAFAMKYPFIRVIHKNNEGVAAARNAGIEQASGEWLYFVDSDDWMAENALEKLYQRRQDYANADIVLLDAYRNMENKEYSWEHFHEERIWHDKREIEQLQIGALYFPLAGKENKNPLAAPWDKLFRRKFVLENKLRFQECLRVLDDMIFCMEAFGKAKGIVYCKEKVYHYRYVPNSITNSYKPSRVDQDRKVWEYIQKYIKKQVSGHLWGQEEKECFEEALYCRIIKSYSICCRLCFFNPANKRKTKDKIAYALHVLTTEPYAEAFQKAHMRNLEWKLKVMAFMGKLKWGKGIYLLHLLESSFGKWLKA